MAYGRRYGPQPGHNRGHLLSDATKSVRVELDSGGIVQPLQQIDSGAHAAADSLRQLAEQNRQAGEGMRTAGQAAATEGQSLGAAAEQARQQSSSLQQLTQAHHGAASAAHEHAGGLGELKEVGGELVGVLGELGIALGAVEIGKQIFEATNAAQQVTVGLEIALRGTGDAVGYTQEQLGAYAEQIQRTSTYSKVQIEQAELVDLQYTKLGGTTFKRLIQDATDLAAAMTARGMMTTPAEEARTLGRAMEEPELGFKRLQQAGVIFSTAEKEQITTMVQHGDRAGALSIMFDRLEASSHGAALAMQDTLGGAVDVLKANLEELAVTIGSAFSAEGIGSIQELSAAVRDLTENLSSQGGASSFLSDIEHFLSSANFDPMANGLELLSLKIGDNEVGLIHDWDALHVAVSTTWAQIRVDSAEGVASVLESMAELSGAFAKLWVRQENKDRFNQLGVELSEAAQNLKQGAADYAAGVEKANAALMTANTAPLEKPKPPKPDDTTPSLSKQAVSARAEIEALIAKEQEAATASGRLAQAELGGAEAVRQANTQHTLEKALLQEATIAKKAKIEVTQSEIDRTKAASATTAANTLEGIRNKAMVADSIAGDNLAAANQARLADAKSGNTAASRILAAQLAAENSALAQGFATIENGHVVLGRHAQDMINEAAGRERSKIATDNTVRSLADERAADEALSTARAALADAESQTTVASAAEADAQKAANDVRARGMADSLVAFAQRQWELSQRRAGLQVYADEKTALESLRQSYKDVDTAQARAADNKQLQAATQEYGSTVANILKQAGLLDTATKQLAIHEAALADARVKDGSMTVAAVEAELLARQQVLDTIARESTEQDIYNAQLSEFTGSLSTTFSNLSSQLGGAGTQLGAITAGLAQMATGFGLVAKEGASLNEQLQGVAGIINGIGAGLKALNVGASDKTGGTSALGGRMESNYAGVGSLAGTIIGGIIGGIIAYASDGIGAGAISGGAAIGGAVGTALGAMISKAGDSASAHLQQDGTIIAGEVSKQLSGAIDDALTKTFQQVNAELASLGMFSSGIPLIDIKVRDNIIRVVVGSMVRTFSSMQDAISFATAEAIKESAAGGHLDPNVLKALSNTTATDMAGLQSDIAFAQGIVNIGVPAVVQAIDKDVSDYMVAMQRGASLGMDMAKEVGNFATQMQAEKDSLLGINQNLSPQEKLTRDAAAFNQEEKLVEAQQKSNIADLDVKKALLQAEMAIASSHVQVARATLDTDEAVNQTQLASLKAIDAAIAVSQGIIDGLVTITDAELANALAHIRNTSGGQTPQQQLQTTLEQDRIARMAATSQALANINAKYDDEAKKAGRNADLLKQVAAAREAEIAALAQQVRAQYITPNLGGEFAGSRSSYAQTLRDEDAARADLVKNAKALGIPLWQINQSFIELHKQLGIQAAADIGIESAALIQKYDKEGQAISFLKDNMDKLGMTTQQLQGWMQELSDQTEEGIFGKVSQYITNEQELARFKDLQYQLDVARAKEELALADAAGALTQAAYDELHGILYNLPADMPTAAAAASSAASQQSSAAGTQLQAAQAQLDAAQKITDWANGIRTNPTLSNLSPAQQVATAKALEEADYSAAMGGNAAARDRFTSDAENYLNLFVQTWGRTGAYGATSSLVLAEADALATMLRQAGAVGQQAGDLVPGQGNVSGGPYHAPPGPRPPFSAVVTPIDGPPAAPPSPPPTVQSMADGFKSVTAALGAAGDLYKLHSTASVAATVYYASTLRVQGTMAADLAKIAASNAIIASQNDRIWQRLLAMGR